MRVFGGFVFNKGSFFHGYFCKSGEFILGPGSVKLTGWIEGAVTMLSSPAGGEQAAQCSPVFVWKARQKPGRAEEILTLGRDLHGSEELCPYPQS